VTLRYEKPRRRAPKDIAYAIAKTAYAGQRKTRIMYAAGLNLTQLNEYLAALSSQGLIALETRERVYLTTEKGRQFVRAYEKYSETRDLLSEQERTLCEFWAPLVRRGQRLEALPQLSV
jgi:predicted transcriptional regulator